MIEIPLWHFAVGIGGLLASSVGLLILLLRARDRANAWMWIAEQRAGQLALLTWQLRKGTLQWRLVEEIERELEARS